MEALMGHRRPATPGGDKPESHFRLPRRVDLSLIVDHVPMPEGGLTPIACPRCQSTLCIHQPDPNFPDLLLGTCGECGNWFLVGLSPDGREALSLNLPDLDEIRGTLAEG
jgi:hypothetical protein